MGEHGAVQRGKKKNLRCGQGGGCVGAEAARPRGGSGAGDEFPPPMETRPFNGVWERCCPTSRASWIPGCWGSALRAPRADVGAMSSCSWPPRGVQALLACAVSPFFPCVFPTRFGGVLASARHRVLMHGVDEASTKPKKPRKARGKRGVSGRDGEDGNKSCRNPTAPARSAQSFADVPRLGASRGLLFQPRPLWVCSATGVGAVGAVSPPPRHWQKDGDEACQPLRCWSPRGPKFCPPRDPFLG